GRFRLHGRRGRGVDRVLPGRRRLCRLAGRRYALSQCPDRPDRDDAAVGGHCHRPHPHPSPPDSKKGRLSGPAAQTKTPPSRTALKYSGSQVLTASRRCDQAFALCALASQLAGATNGLGLLASLLLRGLLVVVAKLHLAEDAFALQLLLERAQRLINVVIANDYLQRSTAPSKLMQNQLDGSAKARTDICADQLGWSSWRAL